MDSKVSNDIASNMLNDITNIKNIDNKQQTLSWDSWLTYAGIDLQDENENGNKRYPLNENILNENRIKEKRLSSDRSNFEEKRRLERIKERNRRKSDSMAYRIRMEKIYQDIINDENEKNKDNQQLSPSPKNKNRRIGSFKLRVKGKDNWRKFFNKKPIQEK